MHKLSGLFLLILCALLALVKATLVQRPNKTEAKELLAKILELRDTLNDIASPYLKITITDIPPNCVQMQCKVLCFNGKSLEIEKDINQVVKSTHINCEVFDEVQLWNYDFPDTIIRRNFLGSYTAKIKSLYLANSNVTDYEDGAFGNGIFEKLTFENLKLLCLRRGLFKNVNPMQMQSLIVVQKETPLESICEGTLADMEYRIKYLTLQVGIPCIRNVTASNVLLNNLGYVDFSYNYLGSGLRTDTFDMLSMVEHLILSHSNITYLPEYIFHKLDLLAYLDLSYNHLTTISANIFGWSQMGDLKIYANDNDWDCDCALQREMKIIFEQQAPLIYCKSPAEYANWSVFADELCADGGYTTSGENSTTTIKSTTHVLSTTAAPLPTIDGGGGASVSVYTPTTTTASQGLPYAPTQSTTKMPLNQLINLECEKQSSLERFNLKILTASMDFNVNAVPNLSVDVILKVADKLDDAFGLIWFSKVTKEYYKMEVNYNEYGFGCFGSISYKTTVHNLLPDVAYTFCLVHHDQLTVSPFNCKSAHVPGNLGVRYNAWLTRDLRATGISLFILGIVIFSFIGIFAIFILLKNKPTLLKGSKRVATTKGNINEIVVLPKDRTLEELRYKEEMLAKRNSKSIISNLPQRRRSTDSSVSYQSYMNANLYEELPAYIKVEQNSSIYNSAEPEKDYSYNYIPALSVDSDNALMVSYAEIPFRHKRTSNDPLPAVPKDEKELEAQHTRQLGVIRK